MDGIKENHKEFIKNNKSILKIQGLKVKDTMLSLKKFTRLLQIQMMIKECNQLIRSKHMHMEQAKI